MVEILLMVSVNGLYNYQNSNSNGRTYLVEAGRVMKEIEKQK